MSRPTSRRPLLGLVLLGGLCGCAATRRQAEPPPATIASAPPLAVPPIVLPAGRSRGIITLWRERRAAAADLASPVTGQDEARGDRPALDIEAMRGPPLLDLHPAPVDPEDAEEE